MPRAATLAQLQTQIDDFLDEYNHYRPHCSLPRTTHTALGHPRVRRRRRAQPVNPHGALVPVPTEQAALARMKQLHRDGVSTREIARVLTAEGHPTRKGGSTWHHATVARILARADTKGTDA